MIEIQSCETCSSLASTVYLPTEMEAAVSAPAKPHPVPAGSAAHIGTALLQQHHRTLER